MERHLKIARAHRALAFLYALMAVVFSAIVFMNRSGKPVPAAILLILILFAALFAVHFFTARGAFQRKNAARIASMVIGILVLPGFPAGTLIGLYLLAYTWKPWDEPVTAAPIASTS